MKDIFQDENKDVLEAVDWSIFGLKDYNGYQSTIWIGSEGCFTPCHQDTYGFNLVAQIDGVKRWMLFPPEQSSKLRPTRIPYEESSVFASVDVKSEELKDICYQVSKINRLFR